MKKWIIISAVAAVLIFAGVLAFMRFTNNQTPDAIHLHADFKIYLNGQAYNFTQDKYMSSEGHHLSERTHLHDMNGNIIHVHAFGVTLGEFFNSLGMKFNSTCFRLDNGTEYCNVVENKLMMFVNGQENSQMEKYEPKDLDRILVTYGSNENEIQNQINSVTDVACIYSLKCPERGSPPNESSCIGGNGTMCTA